MDRLLLLSLMILLWALSPAQVRAETYATCRGFIETIPTTITTPGTWCLRKDLSTAIVSGNAIDVNANNVTIDCNGHKIGGLAAGNQSTGFGIRTYRSNFTLRNCHVRGFYASVVVHGGTGHVIEDNRIDNSVAYGIAVHSDGSSGVIRGNVLSDIGMSSVAVAIQGDADVLDNIINGVYSDYSPGFLGSTGISVIGEGGQLIRGNVVRNVFAAENDYEYGIAIQGHQVRVTRNHIVARSRNGARASVSSFGISGRRQEYATTTVCDDNFISGFETPVHFCIDAGNNRTLER